MEIRGQEVIGVKLTVEKIEKEKEEEALKAGSQEDILKEIIFHIHLSRMEK